MKKMKGDISKDQFLQFSSQFFPKEASEYVWNHFDNNMFSLNIVSPRKTKKGDFRFSKNPMDIPVISINNNLCSYEFLLVYIHELAHYMVFRHHNIFLVKSHGVEWKTYFKELLLNLVDQVALPDDISTAFRQYSLNIKSYTGSDFELETVLDQYRNKQPDHFTYLRTLQEGERFLFRGKVFKMEALLRTRARCSLEGTKLKYLISGMMKVEKLTN